MIDTVLEYNVDGKIPKSGYVEVSGVGLFGSVDEGEEGGFGRILMFVRVCV